MLRQIICLLMLLTSTTVLANSARYEFKAKGNADAAGRPGAVSEKGAILNYDFAAELTLGLLLGEPVVSLRFKYDILGGFVTLPLFEKGQDPYYTKQFDLLDSDSQDLIRLYNAKINFTLLTGNGKSVELQVDAGYLKEAGQWSYNVAGSPDWGRLFIVQGSRGKGKLRYLSAKDARNAWRSGLKLSSWEIENIEIYFTKLHQKFAVGNDQARLKAALSAVNVLESDISSRSGFKFKPQIDPLRKLADKALLQDATQGDVRAALKMAYQRIDKLSDPPSILVKKDITGAQALSIGKAWTELQRAESSIATFFDPEKDALLKLTQGAAPMMDNTPLSQPIGPEHPEFNYLIGKLNRQLSQQEEEISRRPYKEINLKGGAKGTGHVYQDSVIGKWYYKNYRKLEDSNNVEFVDIRDVAKVTLEQRCPSRYRETECVFPDERDYRVRLHCKPDDECVGFKSVARKSKEKTESTRKSMYFLYCYREDVNDLAKTLVSFGEVFGNTIRIEDEIDNARCSNPSSKSRNRASSSSSRPDEGKQKAGTYYLAWQTDQSEKRLESCAPFRQIMDNGTTDSLRCVQMKSAPVYLYDPCKSEGGTGEYYRMGADVVLIKLTGLKPNEFEKLRRAGNNTQVASKSSIQALSAVRDYLENTHRHSRDRHLFVDTTGKNFMITYNRIISMHKALGCKRLDAVK